MLPNAQIVHSYTIKTPRLTALYSMTEYTDVTRTDDEPTVFITRLCLTAPRCRVLSRTPTDGRTEEEPADVRRLRTLISTFYYQQNRCLMAVAERTSYSLNPAVFLARVRK